MKRRREEEEGDREDRAELKTSHAGEASASFDAAASGAASGALSAAEVLALVNEAPLPSFDASTVRASIARLRRCLSVNAEQRLRFPSEPLRFLDSEVELHAAVQAVAAVSTSPALYPALFASDAVDLLVALLAHDNADVANAAVNALQEILDAEALLPLDDSTAQEGLQRLVRAGGQGRRRGQSGGGQ